jgi:hypothetical protein
MGRQPHKSSPQELDCGLKPALYKYFVKASLFLKLFKSGIWGDSPIKAPRRGWISGVSPRYVIFSAFLKHP